MSDHIHHLEDIIANRRTVKPDQFTGERVDDALIQNILESANWAPTHGYTEPWRFTVFADDGLATLGDFMAKLDQPDKSAEGFNQMRFDRLRNRPLKCSHALGIGMQRGNNEKIPELEELCSVAMAVQNVWLSCHAHGLASYWSTGSMAFRDEMRVFFGLPEGARSLGLFYIGKPAIPNPTGRRLSSIEDKVSWVRS